MAKMKTCPNCGGSKSVSLPGGGSAACSTCKINGRSTGQVPEDEAKAYKSGGSTRASRQAAAKAAKRKKGRW
jgi:hypothetical protein